MGSLRPTAWGWCVAVLALVVGTAVVPRAAGAETLTVQSPPSAQGSSQPQASQPQASQSEGRPAKTRLDGLYERLAAAKSEEEAAGIANAIERALLDAPTDTAELLMHRAMQAFEAKENDVALTLIDAIVALDPDFVEAWNKRATLLYLQNDYAGAMADLWHVVVKEPRHFGAWSGIGIILQAVGNKPKALEAFRRAQAIHPHMKAVKRAIETLTPEVEGRPI